jgi:hypothetical protein
MTKGEILTDDSQVYDLRGVKRLKDPEFRRPFYKLMSVIEGKG